MNLRKVDLPAAKRPEFQAFIVEEAQIARISLNAFGSIDEQIGRSDFRVEDKLIGMEAAS